MKPHPDLVDLLGKNKCRVSYRGNNKSFMYLLIDYSQLTKNKPGQGFEIWGNAQQVFEKVNATVRRFYPQAELASQDGSRTVVYRIGIKVK